MQIEQSQYEEIVERVVKMVMEKQHGNQIETEKKNSDAGSSVKRIFRFAMPPMSLMGAGCLREVGLEAGVLGLKKALIITDKILLDIGLVNKLTDVLTASKIKYAVYSGTQPNPTADNVMQGLKMLKRERCDFVISFGGGSPHDCAKCVALLATNGGKIKDYEGVNKSKKPQLPLIAINTTAGTASEMTMFCIITDEEKHIKMAIVDKNMTPMIAVNDPELMLAMPRGLTAATGMDALTHAVEAYISTNATPITDACAKQAIKLIARNLKLAVEDGSNLEAREKMAYAEFLAGMAFSNASLGCVHAMAHQLGGLYDLPHGVCNAVLLPFVQEFNAKAAARKLREVAACMGVDVYRMSDEEGAGAMVAAVRELSACIGIPTNLTILGVKAEDIELLAENALKDTCCLTNPVKAEKSDIVEIFTRAMTDVN